MEIKEKSQYLRKYSKKMRLRTAWMFDSTKEDNLEEDKSDF